MDCSIGRKTRVCFAKQELVLTLMILVRLREIFSPSRLLNTLLPGLHVITTPMGSLPAELEAGVYVHD